LASNAVKHTYGIANSSTSIKMFMLEKMKPPSKRTRMLERNGKLFIYHHEKTMVIEDVGGKIMGKCPKCGTQVATPRKKWTMAGRPDKSGKRMQLEIGLFDCPKCKKPFREVLSKKKV